MIISLNLVWQCQQMREKRLWSGTTINKWERKDCKVAQLHHMAKEKFDLNWKLTWRKVWFELKIDLNLGILSCQRPRLLHLFGVEEVVFGVDY